MRSLLKFRKFKISAWEKLDLRPGRCVSQSRIGPTSVGRSAAPRIGREARRSSVKGQATLEYALVLAIMAGFAVSLTSSFSKVIKDVIVGNGNDTSFNKLVEESLQTGSYPDKDKLWSE